MVLWPLIAPFHKGTDGGRRGVEYRDSIFLNDLPKAPIIRPVGRAFIDYDRGSILERAVYNVAVSGYPANIGSAPKNILGFQIKDKFCRE